MSLVQEVSRDDASAMGAIGITDTAEGLAAIQHPRCAASLWRRQAPPGFQSWIDGLRPGRLPKARTIVWPADVRDAVRHICDTSGTPDCAERTWLIDDVAALAGIFAGLMRAPYLRLRFDVVTTNMCRKFHIDAVTARLICTYRGTGTQYGIAADGLDPRRVFTAPTGAPIVLRGTLWPEQLDAGLRHRSPPIEGTGETRLVLVLDPVTGPENET